MIKIKSQAYLSLKDKLRFKLRIKHLCLFSSLDNYKLK